MKEIDKASTIQPSGLRGYVLRMAPIIMAFFGFRDGFHLAIDGHDLVLARPGETFPGEWLGDYKYLQRGVVTIPSRWVEQERGGRGTQVCKYLDAHKGHNIIRLRISK